MKRLSLLILSVVSVVSAAQGETVYEAADTSAVRLHDVEIVSVKQNAVNPIEPVTTLSTAELERLDITAVKDVGTVTPNFYMPDYGSRMTSSIYVRGLGTRIDQPAVGLNIDNVPFLNKDNYDFDLADIDRIEVVRGSNGIINGRNALGGQINVYTLSPWNVSGLRFLAEYGKANSTRFAAGYYTRIGDRLATSVSGNFTHTDGFFRNEANGRKVGSENAGGARWKLSWHPESRWSLMNVASVSAGKQDGYPYASVETSKIAYNDSTFYKRTSFTDGLTVSYTGNRMIATSITSVQYSDDNMTLDQDFLPEDYFTLTQKRHEWVWTQDLFAKGKRGCYSWLMGAFGFYKSTRMAAPVTFLNTGISRLIEDNINRVVPAGMAVAFDERSLLLDSNFKIRTGGGALYHQSALKVGKFLFQLGLRWDIEHISFDYTSDADASVTMYREVRPGMTVPLGARPLAVHDLGHLSETYNVILPQFAAGYSDGPWQASLRIAKGYKAGGYNTQMFSDILQQQLMEAAGVNTAYDINEMLTYRPEKAWTYELTGEYADPAGRFGVEAVVFLMRVRDQQLTVFPDGNTTGRAMTNAGRTRSAGVELTSYWNPVEKLRFNLSYGFTNAEFTRYDNGKTDLAGKRLPYAPSHTLFVSGAYSLPKIGAVTTELNLFTRGAGDIFWDDANTVKQNFYATLGASVVLNHRLGSLTLWGENLTNTRYNTFYFVSIGNAFVQRARPVSFGVTLRFNIL